MFLALRVNHPLRVVYKLKPVTLALSKYSTDSDKKLKSGKIFINGIAPQFLGRLDPRIYLPSFSNDSITKVRDDYVPKSLSFGARLKDVEFRKKEGGAILVFEFLPSADKDSAQALQKIAQEVVEYIAASKKKGFLNLMNIHVYTIKGEPFLEDLVFSLPTRILKVEFIGTTLCEEDLFKEFRPFGRISKITIHNPESSGFPKYALVHYFNGNSATAARICLNGQRDCATRFSISYKKRDGKFWKWITSHPHIMFPLILGSLLGLLYAVFDPVRVFCISSKISGRFDLIELSFLKEMKIFALKLLKSRENSEVFDKMNAASGLEQEEKIYEIQQLLTGLPESFVYLQGPKGSGREVALLKSLEDKENVLHIFCDKVSQDSISINFAALAKEVGYFPVFDVLNKAVGLADKFLVSMTGKSSDLSPSSEKQFQNLLDCTQLTLAGFSSDDSDAPLPVIVFHNFLLKDSPDCDWIKVTRWAAEMVERKLAHVVFSSESAITARILKKSIPYQPLTMVEFEDIQLGEAIAYVQTRINQYLPVDIRQSLQYFGGRISDLNLFSLKILKGEPAAESFDEIVASAESEIRRKLFKQPWEKHAPLVTLGWLLVEALSAKPRLHLLQANTNMFKVGYDEIRYSSSFLGSDQDLSDLETAGIISIQLNHNKQKIIKPERPIFCKAFQIIVNDNHLAASVSRFKSELFFKDRQQKILSTQEELAKLAKIQVEVPFPWYKFALLSYWFSFNSCYVVAPQPVRARITYLLSKLNTLQTELQQAEAKIKEANSILLTPYSGLS